MAMRAIEVRQVSRSYKATKALTQISMKFEYGKIYGLLGRNGAGKSTLLNIISGRIFPDEGTVTVDGEPIRDNIKVQEKLYCMSEADMYPNLKITDIFRWTGQFYSVFSEEKARKLADAYGLDCKKKVQQLSTGYRSIFKLILALSLDVPYVIFDEPVLGLDANHREMFYKMLLEDYTDNPRTIILATHLIEEVAGIVEEVIIVDNGKVLLEDSVEHLMECGYSVAGRPADVDAYTADQEVLDTEEIAGMKIAYMLGEICEEKLNEKLTVSSLNLQKLFVKLTEKGGSRK